MAYTMPTLFIAWSPLPPLANLVGFDAPQKKRVDWHTVLITYIRAKTRVHHNNSKRYNIPNVFLVAGTAVRRLFNIPRA